MGFFANILVIGARKGSFFWKLPTMLPIFCLEKGLEGGGGGLFGHETQISSPLTIFILKGSLVLRSFSTQFFGTRRSTKVLLEIL